LRQGHILYSLYGHEGAANAVGFSPNGDFFTTAGSDAIVMCWKSNLNELDTETIDDIGGKTAPNVPAKTTTAMNPVPKLRPSSARAAGAAVQVKTEVSPTKSYKAKETISQRSTIQASPAATNVQSAVKTGNNFAIQSNSDAQIGAVHQQNAGGIAGSGEELALTLEKVVSQLDIISRTLHVLEQRVSMNENSVSVCMQYFRDHRDRGYQMHFAQRGSARSSAVHEQLHQHQENLESERVQLQQLKVMTETVHNGLKNLSMSDNMSGNRA
jgi:centriolar protein POC1